ncbi:Uncharacterised protein [BD1-7 clade bacterium]|uniref:Uncharacterized protein n=1 Tax=BD1-7 clade bacterium TaxID=2029982 RepID=A0A5S9P5Z8_9GAMM|nr:Uncharacterised protein [BD1-7 clade bacterium]CAA0098961.1 Uncharacterised protein [BD1-7 clade bacterium]CAA0121562.1 Uncharacterised protein [BD1-7 clade bacterium]
MPPQRPYRTRLIRTVLQTLVWIITAILLTTLYRFFLVAKDYHWADSFYVWIGGLYSGLFAGVMQSIFVDKFLYRNGKSEPVWLKLLVAALSLHIFIAAGFIYEMR